MGAGRFPALLAQTAGDERREGEGWATEKPPPKRAGGFGRGAGVKPRRERCAGGGRGRGRGGAQDAAETHGRGRG